MRVGCFFDFYHLFQPLSGTRMRNFHGFCSVNEGVSRVALIFGVCLFLTFLGGCRNNPCNQGGRDPLVGETRLPPPATTRRAVFVRNDRGNAGNVIPGGPKMASSAPVKPMHVAGQNPAPPAAGAPAAPNATGWTAITPGSGGRIPVSQPAGTHEPNVGSGASVATGSSAEPYITRYAPSAEAPENSKNAVNTENALSAGNVPLHWIPITGQAPAGERSTLKPTNTAEISYARRFPYAKIVPPPLQPGVVKPREEAQQGFFPEIQTPPPVEPYCEQREARASDAWVQTLHGPYTLDLRPAPPVTSLLPAPAPPIMAETHPAIGKQPQNPPKAEEPEIRTDCPVPSIPPPRRVQPRFLKTDPAVIDLRSLPVAGE